MADIFIKYPDLTAYVPTGGFPHFVPKAFRRVAGENQERIRTKQTAVVVADTLPMQIFIFDIALLLLGSVFLIGIFTNIPLRFINSLSPVKIINKQL